MAWSARSRISLRRLLVLLVASLVAFSVAPSSLAFASTLTYDAANGLISFIAPNPPNTSEILAGGVAGDTFRFENVITVSGVEVDAIVEIVELQNSESGSGLGDSKMDRIDDNDSVADLEVSFRNTASSPGLGFVVFDIQFVNNASEAVILENVALTVTDVDNDQFVQFGGLTSYRLADSRAASDVVAGTGTASFTTSGTNALSATVPAGSVHFFASGNSSSGDSDAEKEKHWVQAQFATVSELRIKLGSYSIGSANIDHSFALTTFTAPATSTVVSRPNFTVTYDANSGSGVVPSPTTSNTSMTVAGNTGSPALERAGYTFGGWNTRADGAGATYAPGSSILPVADTTLYALWTPIPQPAGPSAGGGSQPAIHLDLQGRVNQTAPNTPVLMEGEVLKPGSSYSLTLRQPAQTIKSGVVNSGGRFSHLMALPANLAPGSYTLTLQAVGVNGESLVLTQSISVGANGVLTRIGRAIPTVSGGLAATGANDAVVVGGLATAVLLGLAGAAMLSLRRSQPGIRP